MANKRNTLKSLSDSTNLPSNFVGSVLKKIPIVRKNKSLITVSKTQNSKDFENQNNTQLDKNEEFYAASQHLKSWIWKYLLISSSGRLVKCKICNQVYSRTCGSTTGFGRHLSKNHSDVLKKAGIIIPPSHDESGFTENSSISSNESFQQSPLKRDFKSAKRKSSESDIDAKNADSLFITKRFKPETKSIKNYKDILTRLNQFYDDPYESLDESDAESIVELSDKLEKEIKEKISNSDIKSICLSGEQWLNDKNESFLGLNIHYLDSDFNDKHISFGLKELKPTSQNIENLLSKWNIKSKINYFVSNMKINLDGVINIPDTCHVINECIKDVLTPGDTTDSDEFNFELISNKFISTVVKKCFKFAELISKMIDQTLDLSPRWTSIYTVFNTLIENREYLNQLLSDDTRNEILKNYFPNEVEFQYINDFIIMFEPLRRMTIELSEKHYSSCSLLYPGLFYFINHLKKIELSTVEFEKIKVDLANKMRNRFSYLLNDNSELFLSLSFLDYRFKYFRIFNSEILANSTHDRVKSYLLRLYENKYSTDSADFEIEFKDYLEFQPPNYYEKPLDFYKNNGHKFPILSKLARDLFSLCSSAVPVDRIFTSSSESVYCASNRLDKSKLEFVSFVKENFDLN